MQHQRRRVEEALRRANIAQNRRLRQMFDARFLLDAVRISRIKQDRKLDSAPDSRGFDSMRSSDFTSG